MNLNQRASARLTETGLRVLDEFEAELGLPARHRRMSVSDGNLWRGQLWSLMQDFGASISLGMHEGPFVDNRVDVEPFDDGPVVQRSEPGGYAEPTLPRTGSRGKEQP